MKTFVITVSKTFQSKHPRKGQKTFFKKKILANEKIHTIRGNYKYWNKIVKQVNKAEAVLSLREWTGKPYNSKQKEIKKYTKLGIQEIYKISNYIEIDKIPYPNIMVAQIAKNDGLSEKDFLSWFPFQVEKGAIIHFTDYRY